MREYFADPGLDKKIEEYAKAQKADISLSSKKERKKNMNTKTNQKKR